MENQNAAKKRKNKLGTRRKGFIIAFLAPTLIAFCVFYLYPIITVFITSFCKWDYTNITSPEFFGWSNLWDNYDYIFIDTYSEILFNENLEILNNCDDIIFLLKLNELELNKAKVMLSLIHI